MEDWILVYSEDTHIFFINEHLSEKIKNKKIKIIKKRNSIINAELKMYKDINQSLPNSCKKSGNDRNASNHIG